MSHFRRIQTIWRKELLDTLRDRRTLLAMVLVPIVLYPVMIVGSLQGFEIQVSRLKRETYRVGVLSAEVQEWLERLIDTDPARQPGAAQYPAEALVERAEQPTTRDANAAPMRDRSAAEAAREDVRGHPPNYEIILLAREDLLRERIADGSLHVGLRTEPSLPAPGSRATSNLTIVLDQTDIRSQIAAAGLEGILQRAGDFLLARRLQEAGIDPAYIHPIELTQETVASPERVGGSILGQVVPLILIIMTITGAIYPAIDLTAGERERGTLETLMVAPVPTVDLIAGKFVVVAFIAMLSAVLNLLSIGGTIYLGGLGNLLARGSDVAIPIQALPWVLLILIPIAVMFSAVLLAVCSFARSFKEAQNYVMPVMVAALIPAVIGVLPGTRLEGPLLIMPVANIVVLTRDLFTGRFEPFAILWVTVSTTLYAGAAVAVAARLFGQEAVLFADSGSIRTLFRRRFFRPVSRPPVAHALLLLALTFSLNFFTQQQLLRVPAISTTSAFWIALAVTLIVLFVLLPVGVSWYARVNLRSAFALDPPAPAAWLAALCFGCSTWVLARAWIAVQRQWLPMPPEMEEVLDQMERLLDPLGTPALLIFVALIPAVCEETFFRGYVLSAATGGLGNVAGVLLVAVAFGVFHHSVHRLAVSAGLGLLFAVLVVRFGSLWPAIIAHALHNGISVLVECEGWLRRAMESVGYRLDAQGAPPAAWAWGAAVLCGFGLVLCVFGRERRAGETAARAG